MKEIELYQKISARLGELEKDVALKEDMSIAQLMDEKGVSRRDFMKWAAAMTALLSLPASFTPLVAKAAELTDRLPVIWLHMAECTGCSASLLRTEAPGVDGLIFDHISLEYHETLMAAVGWQSERILMDSIERHRGKFILMVEGAVPAGDSDFYLTIGPHGKSGKYSAKKCSEAAAAIFAIGTCSSFGGVQAAHPNPTNAQALSKITNRAVINVPGCPPSEKNIVGNILHYILFGTLPSLDVFNRPKWAYGLRIHDLCERRGRFGAGEFVQEFGDDGAKKGYCLFKVGCKGPYTFNNCGKDRFNQGTSWPVMAGHGCMGCSEPNFWDTMGPFHEPLAGRLYDTVYGTGVDRISDYVGIGVLSAVAVGIAAHAALTAYKAPKIDK